MRILLTFTYQKHDFQEVTFIYKEQTNILTCKSVVFIPRFCETLTSRTFEYTFQVVYYIPESLGGGAWCLCIDLYGLDNPRLDCQLQSTVWGNKRHNIPTPEERCVQAFRVNSMFIKLTWGIKNALIYKVFKFIGYFTLTYILETNIGLERRLLLYQQKIQDFLNTNKQR